MGSGMKWSWIRAKDKPGTCHLGGMTEAPASLVLVKKQVIVEEKQSLSPAAEAEKRTEREERIHEEYFYEGTAGQRRQARLSVKHKTTEELTIEFSYSWPWNPNRTEVVLWPHLDEDH